MPKSQYSGSEMSGKFQNFGKSAGVQNLTNIMSGPVASLLILKPLGVTNDDDTLYII